MELTAFALFLVKTVDVEHIKGMLKTFLKTVQRKPQSIITEDNFLYDQTVSQLKEEGVIEAEHLYQFASYAEKVIRTRYKVKKIVWDLCKEPVKAVFFQKLQNYRNRLDFQ